VHRLAKQRHATVAAQREARAQAAMVIATARALCGETEFPVNELVDIDRAWRVLDQQLLDDAQRSEFEALMARLAALARERADLPLRLHRWTERARQLLAELQCALADAASGAGSRDSALAAASAARALADDVPAESAAVQLLGELQRTEDLRLRLEGKLTVLEEVLVIVPPPALAEPVESAGAEGQADRDALAMGRDVREAARRWLALAPLDDAALDDLLERRFARWQQSHDKAQGARQAQRHEEAARRRTAARERGAQQLAAAVERGEGALSGGHLAQAHAHLLEIDRLLESGSATGEMRARIDALRAQCARLKGWQHWAGGRARDELVAEAEALTRSAAGAAEPGGHRLTLKQRAEAVERMRARWKELDRLGGATSRSLWRRFDAALEAAYAPVAANAAAQRAAREQNQKAREALLEGLESVPLPEPGEGSAPPRVLLTTLEHFRAEWRRLGPLEHTVAHAARAPLAERMEAATRRLEAPLQDLWREVRQAREALIARALALAAEAPGRDLVDRVRDLQAQWQRHAREQPLPRADEAALWAEFRSALDAAFSARDAAFKAREAGFRAHATERAALIERLDALTAGTPAGQLRKVLAETDARWQRTGPAPRGEAAALDARYHRARERVRSLCADGDRRAWDVTCDALATKLALCDEIEHRAAETVEHDDLRRRWADVPRLPEPFERTLCRRAGLPCAGPDEAQALADTSTDDLLLQLEAAWGLESPPQFDQARRLLKLQAMKAALETRRSVAPASPSRCVAALLGRGGLDELQRTRLGGVLEALRHRGSIEGV
jgi:hypothetical protein